MDTAREEFTADELDGPFPLGESLASEAKALPGATEIALDCLHEAVWVVQGSPLELSPETLRYANASTEVVTGYRPQELARYGWRALLGDQVSEAGFSFLRSGVQSGVACDQRFLIERRDQTRFWGQLELQPSDQRRGWWSILLRDLTEVSEMALQPTRERDHFAEVLQLLGEAVLTVDLEGRVTFLNRLAQEWTGWREGEAFNRPICEILRLLDRSKRPLAPLNLETVFDEGELAEVAEAAWIESRVRSVRRIKLRINTLRDHRRQVCGASVLLQPVQNVGTPEVPAPLMPAGMAHDFNNLLTGIIGNLNMVCEGALDPSQSDRMLSIALSAAERAQQLCKRMMSKESEALPASNRMVMRLPEVIRECVGFVVASSRCRVTPEIDENIWLARIDEGHFCQILNNLLLNATQAMPNGGLIRVVARNRELRNGDDPVVGPGPAVEIEVADAGPGIPPEVLSRIFDPYFTTKAEGTGLGLANCLALARANHGNLSAESPPEHGAIFRLLLPASRVRGGEPVPGPKSRSAVHGKGRILVIDDEALIRQISCDMLTHLGYSASPVENVDQACELLLVARLEREPFDAAMLDLSIVGADRVCHAREQLTQACPGLATILSSGYDGHPLMRNAEENGFAAAIAKPYNIQRLGKLLNQLLLPSTGSSVETDPTAS